MSRSQRMMVALGVTAIVVYLATTTGLVREGGNVTRSLVFGIGPIAIVGVLAVTDRLSSQANPGTVRLCRVFLVTAFVLLTLMVVVQQMTFMQFRDLRAAATDAQAAETLKTVFKGVHLVQLGIDVAFDIFYCLGVFTLGAAMVRHREFGKFLGIAGMASAVALLALNLYAFPYIPRESGLVDLGPVTGVWWLLVIAQSLRNRWRERRFLRAA